MESAVSFAPLRPADFVNFAGRGGAGQGLLFAGRGGAGQPVFPRGGAGRGGASIPGARTHARVGGWVEVGIAQTRRENHI